MLLKLAVTVLILINTGPSNVNVVKSSVCCNSIVISLLNLVPLCMCNPQKQFNLEKILQPAQLKSILKSKM